MEMNPHDMNKKKRIKSVPISCCEYLIISHKCYETVLIYCLAQDSPDEQAGREFERKPVERVDNLPYCSLINLSSGFVR